MDSIAQAHLDSLLAKNETQVAADPLVKRYTLLLAHRLFVSIEDEKHIASIEKHYNALGSGLINLPIDLPGTPFNKSIKASKFIRKQLVDIIRQRKVDLSQGNNNASPKQDILSNMLLICDMDEWQIADQLLGILFGCYDTISTTCTLIIKYLSQFPHMYHRVYQAPGGFREAIDDFTFNGFSIPKGWKLFWSANSTHKSEKYFPEPEKVDPSRFEGNGPAPCTFVPFGGGPRICPGNEYARLVIMVFLHNLVKRFKWQALNPNENIVVDPFPVPANHLPIRLYPHHKDD
ncbi:hypothetical protein PIB30_023994 [Stylosanthes scabra]|uniref:Cytochrome P450 n=1 Tax=Stylosanthes scabra TaxID=79078 RepID=A0ABU6Y888_9FABA|nr:hypothetical protein [Stylosanthes scabra]